MRLATGTNWYFVATLNRILENIRKGLDAGDIQVQETNDKQVHCGALVLLVQKHIPGYVSGGFISGTWGRMMEQNNKRKDDPSENAKFGGLGADELRLTTQQENEKIMDGYMKNLWERDDDVNVHGVWNLHYLNHYRDPRMKSTSYTGHIPNIRPENLIGASYNKIILTTQKLWDPVTQFHFNPHLVRVDSKRDKAGNILKDDLSTEAGYHRVQAITTTVDQLGMRTSSKIRVPVSNDATVRVPTHHDTDLFEELSWEIDRYIEYFCSTSHWKSR